MADAIGVINAHHHHPHHHHRPRRLHRGEQILRRRTRNVVLSRFQCPLSNHLAHRENHCSYGHGNHGADGQQLQAWPAFLCARHPMGLCRSQVEWNDQYRVWTCTASDNRRRLHLTLAQLADLDHYLQANQPMIGALFGRQQRRQPRQPQQQQQLQQPRQQRPVVQNNVLARIEHRTEMVEIHNQAENEDASNQETQQEDQCAVCLESVMRKYPNDRGQNPNRFAILDPCGHWFCVGCVRTMNRHQQENHDQLDQLFYYQNNNGNIQCPLCREWSVGVRHQSEQAVYQFRGTEHRRRVPSYRANDNWMNNIPEFPHFHRFNRNIGGGGLVEEMLWRRAVRHHQPQLGFVRQFVGFLLQILFNLIDWFLSNLGYIMIIGLVLFSVYYGTVSIMNLVAHLGTVLNQWMLTLVSPFVTLYGYVKPVLFVGHIIFLLLAYITLGIIVIIVKCFSTLVYLLL